MTCWSCKADVSEGTVFCPSCRKIQPVGRGEDYFSLLGLPRDFQIDVSDVERRFRERSRVLHPDRFARAEPRELPAHAFCDEREVVDDILGPPGVLRTQRRILCRLKPWRAKSFTTLRQIRS